MKWVRTPRVVLRMIRMAAGKLNLKEISSTGKITPDMVKKWDCIQEDLRKKIISQDTESWQLGTDDDDLSGLTRVAGVDISVPATDHNAEECDAVAAIVICQYPELNIIHQETQQVRLTVPYMPGYLSFREADPVIDLIQRVVKDHPDITPDVILIDGNGLLHPHRCGLACHVGVQTGIPTIGVAKNLHTVEGVDVSKEAVKGMAASGDFILIKDVSNNILAMALKTADDAKNPIFLSIGHKISLETARRVVLKCSRFRVPEPIRFADNISRELVRKMIEKKSQSENS